MHLFTIEEGTLHGLHDQDGYKTTNGTSARAFTSVKISPTDALIKSLKITILGFRDYFSQNVTILKKSNNLIPQNLKQKYIQEIHPSLPWVSIFVPLHIQCTCSLNSLNTSTTKWKTLNSSHITMNMSCVKKSNSLTMEAVHTKTLVAVRFTPDEINFDVTFNGHQKSSKMVIKYVFNQILMTFTCNMKIDIIIVNLVVSSYYFLFFCELPYQSSIFLTLW